MVEGEVDGGTDYSEIIEEDESLKLFLEKVREFDHKFTKEMYRGADFTIRLEVRGNKGKVLHVRVYHDSIGRPSTVIDQ